VQGIGHYNDLKLFYMWTSWVKIEKILTVVVQCRIMAQIFPLKLFNVNKVSEQK
jgi:hypothetical protein